MAAFPQDHLAQTSPLAETAGAGDETPAAWHTLVVTEVAARLGIDLRHGLTAQEAAARLGHHSLNEIDAVHAVSPWKLLAGQFQNVLIVILLIAVALSALMGHAVEAAAIGVIVLFAVGLGFVQEFRAERALEALRQMAAPTATVLRDGVEVELAARELVPGDVIFLGAGDKVPADGRVIESVNLKAEEAALTGESVPVSKQSEALAAADLPVGDRRNMVYAGTAITYGRGRAVVVATGMQTEFGRIARLLQDIEVSRTPLQENLDRVGKVLAQAAFAIVGVIVVLGFLRGQPLFEMVLFGIALAVAVVPEALPAVVTISLALGVQRMVKRHALIRRLPAVETLGCVSVICSDKTGTLTKDEMTVRKILAGADNFEVTGVGYEPRGEFLRNGAMATSPALLLLLRTAVLASDAQLLHVPDAAAPWSIKGDPTEGALVVAAAKAGLAKSELDAELPRIGEIPFTSETRRMTTLHRNPDGTTTACAKGAPEAILASCARWLSGQGPAPLDASQREIILDRAREMAGEALRVLAVAYKPSATPADAEQDLVFLGLVGMIDPPRPEVGAAIETCRHAGIKAVMITGDHPVTAQAVGRELGMLQNGRVATGSDLDAIDDEQLPGVAEQIDIYARASPAHKLRVVTALQQNGHCVAMTGDGINDAPSLKKAAIGIAMGITGTDVSKEAAAMTLTDDNFASIVAAVEEGRGVFDNIKKYLMYLLSSNIGEIALMAVAVLVGLPLPLTAVQILYVNLATDGLPALALAVDPREPGLMRRPPRDPRVGIFSRPVVALMLIGGIWSAFVNVSLFAWALQSDRTLSEAMSMTFVSLVLIQFLKAYNYRSDRWTAFRKPFANKWLNRAIVWELLLLSLVIYLPVLREPFGTFPLPLYDWVIVIAAAATIAPVLELSKWMIRRGWFGELR
jgi:Ca2+-transporting ATPase